MRRLGPQLLACLLAACSEDPTARPDAGQDLGDARTTSPDVAQEGRLDLPTPGDLGDAPPADGGADLPLQDDTAPPPATELLLFDGDNRQFTAADKGFHPLIQPGDPIPASNWLTPQDFYNGEFQIRYVINAPANQVGGKLQTCIWTMGNGDGDGKNYFPESCSGQVPHTGVGTYVLAQNLAPASWWKNSGVPLDFTHPEWFLIRVVLRGPSGCNVTSYNVTGACWDQWPDYQNMTFRVTIVMVAKGATFSGWGSYP